jgi:hypothetical protein
MVNLSKDEVQILSVTRDQGMAELGARLSDGSVLGLQFQNDRPSKTVRRQAERESLKPHPEKNTNKHFETPAREGIARIRLRA